MNQFEKPQLTDSKLGAKAEPRLIEETPIVDSKKKGLHGKILSKNAIDKFNAEITEKLHDTYGFDRPTNGTPLRAD